MTQQHLVVIAGEKAYRYAGNKRIEECEFSMEDATIEEAKAALEDFRKNGLPPPIIQPADVAFDRAAREMTNKRPIEGLADDELKALWDQVDDDAVFVGGHYRVGDVSSELTRRGFADYLKA